MMVLHETWMQSAATSGLSCVRMISVDVNAKNRVQRRGSRQMLIITACARLKYSFAVIPMTLTNAVTFYVSKYIVIRVFPVYRFAEKLEGLVLTYLSCCVMAKKGHTM